MRIRVKFKTIFIYLLKSPQVVHIKIDETRVFSLILVPSYAYEGLMFTADYNSTLDYDYDAYVR